MDCVLVHSFWYIPEYGLGFHFLHKPCYITLFTNTLKYYYLVERLVYYYKIVEEVWSMYILLTFH